MIGLFDSGIGGLTVVREIKRQLPDYSLVYLGDTARTPYGNKSAEVIKQYGLQAVKFLVDQGAKIIVVACNTVSAVGLNEIKKAYPDIPVFDVIGPAVKATKKYLPSKIKKNKIRHIGVIGTRALVNSNIYQSLFENNNGFKVTALPAPLLVPLVEEGWFKKPETKRIIKFYLRPFKQVQIDTLILACTHYPLLKNLIFHRIGRQVKVIDPAEETALELADWLYHHKQEADKIKKGESVFMVTDYTEQTEKIARYWLKDQSIKLIKVEI